MFLNLNNDLQIDRLIYFLRSNDSSAEDYIPLKSNYDENWYRDNDSEDSFSKQKNKK